MPDPGTVLIATINKIRAACGRYGRNYLWVADTVRGDPERCILAQALECSVGLSEDPEWEAQGVMVMRFPFAWPVKAIAMATAWEIRPELLEVRLPPLLAEFATSFDSGLYTTDELGFVASWLVPIDGEDPENGCELYWLPNMRPTESRMPC